MNFIFIFTNQTLGQLMKLDQMYSFKKKPMKNLIVFVAFLTFHACNTGSNNQTIINLHKGKLDRHENFQSQYVSMRNIDVWLPDGYTETEKYSVLYMHDGQMLFDSSKTWNRQEWGVDEVISDLTDNGLIHSTIVVGIWNLENYRHAEYFPQKPYMQLSKTFRDSLIDGLKQNNNPKQLQTEVTSDNYLKFIVDELKPYIDSKYSTKTDREHTFICGSSMGGLISFYAICEYPEIFGGAACLSTHWPGMDIIENNPIPDQFVEYARKNLPSPDTHKIYFDYGTQTLDAFYEPYQLMIDSVMRQNGFGGTELEIA
jgi:predicted alpha/beta superfamily hydrolase